MTLRPLDHFRAGDHRADALVVEDMVAVIRAEVEAGGRRPGKQVRSQLTRHWRRAMRASAAAVGEEWP